MTRSGGDNLAGGWNGIDERGGQATSVGTGGGGGHGSDAAEGEGMVWLGARAHFFFWIRKGSVGVGRGKNPRHKTLGLEGGRSVREFGQ